MDGALFVFIMFGFIAACFYPIANKAFKYTENRANLMLYQVASKLVVTQGKDENGNDKLYEISELDQAPSDAIYPSLGEIQGQEDEFYINHVKYYYLNYKTGVNVEYPANANPEDYKAPNYQELIDGKPRSEYYTEEWFNEQVASSESIATLISSAIMDLCNEEFYAKKETSVRLTGYFLVLPSFFLSFSIFFIVIPLIFKNGETLGKKTLHLAFVSNDEYQVKKRQIVSRQLLLFFLVAFVCFIIARIGLGSIALLGLGILLYYAVTLISKQKRSPADFFAYTLLVDANKSVWFNDPHQEEKKNEELEEKMEEYKKHKVENKNLLQVGSEIVNEDVKKELEESKKKNNN